MELEHSFSVPVPVERAWDVLLDVERVAPCMPGATLDSVDGDEITGRIKVKVGPIQMTYAGTAKFTERDRDAHVIVLEASGKETRGAGTASASVRSELKADGDQTNVIVHTSLNVTGKPAQFGRGVLAEVGGQARSASSPTTWRPCSRPSPPAAAAPAPAAQAAAAAAAAAEPAAATPAAGSGGAAEEALPIDVLNLSSRAWSSLRHDGIQTLGDLTRRTEQQLRAIDGVGPASLADIRTKLADRGLALADRRGWDEQCSRGRERRPRRRGQARRDRQRRPRRGYPAAPGAARVIRRPAAARARAGASLAAAGQRRDRPARCRGPARAQARRSGRGRRDRGPAGAIRPAPPPLPP